MANLDRDTIRSKVRSFIQTNFLLGDGQYFDDRTELMENGILDSTGAMELVSFLETEFEIAITEQEIVPDNIDSLSRLVDFVAAKRN